MSTTPLTDAFIDRLLRPTSSHSTRLNNPSTTSTSSIAIPFFASLGLSGFVLNYLIKKTYTTGLTCYSSIGTSVGSELLSTYIVSWLGNSSPNSNSVSELKWTDYIPFGNIGSLFEKTTKSISLISLIEPKFMQIQKNILINPSSEINSVEDYVNSLINEKTQNILTTVVNTIQHTITETSKDTLRISCSEYEFWANATITAAAALGILGLSTCIYKACKKAPSQ